MAASEARKKASAKYDAANTVQIKLKLNRRTDTDILDHLDHVDSKQGYIKGLIRKDIAHEIAHGRLEKP